MPVTLARIVVTIILHYSTALFLPKVARFHEWLRVENKRKGVVAEAY